MPYIGGKSQAGVYQKIINLIPPHRVYIEPFLGGGAIMRLKRPAEISHGVDRAAVNPALLQVCQFHCGCGISFLEVYPWQGDEFVYCDPPYLWATRGGRKYYEHEMPDEDHRRLLHVLLKIPAMVMISGYPSEMYDQELAGWNREQFINYTRAHSARQEVLWFNYPRPVKLHDDRYTGINFRERWRIEKKRRRWKARLQKMPPLERETLYAALVDVMRADPRGSPDRALPAGPQILAPEPALPTAGTPDPALGAARA